MGQDKWVENFIQLMAYERGQTYTRESYMMGAWIRGEQVYGLPERA